MLWSCALLAACSAVAAGEIRQRGRTHYYPRYEHKDGARSDTGGDVWQKYQQSLEALPSGDRKAARYLRQLNINHVCTQPNREDLCQRILQSYETGELRKVLRENFYESSIRGRDLMEIVFESLLHSEGLSVPQARAQGRSAFWKYVFGKLPQKFIDDVVEALHKDLSRTCTPEEIQYLMSPSEDNVPSVVGHMRKHSQIYDARRANYLRKTYGSHSATNDRFIPPREGPTSAAHRSEDDPVGQPMPPGGHTPRPTRRPPGTRPPRTNAPPRR